MENVIKKRSDYKPLFWLAKDTYLEFLIFDKYTIVKSKIIFKKNNYQNIFDYNKSIQEALDFPRAFALNGKLKVEKSLNIEIIKKLESIGHNISIVDDAIGGGQCIKIDRDKGVLIGGSDSRKDGLAIGY